MPSSRDIYLFAIWHCWMNEAEKILGEIRARFTVLKQFEVAWCPKDYLSNFAAFYGWKSYAMQFGKRNRAGIGPFLAVFVLMIDRLLANLRDWGIVNLKAPGHEAGLALCKSLEEGAEMIMASLALLALLQSYLIFTAKENRSC